MVQTSPPGSPQSILGARMPSSSLSLLHAVSEHRSDTLLRDKDETNSRRRFAVVLTTAANTYTGPRCSAFLYRAISNTKSGFKKWGWWGALSSVWGRAIGESDKAQQVCVKVIYLTLTDTMASIVRPTRRVLTLRARADSLVAIRSSSVIRQARRGVATIQQTRPVNQSSWTTSRALLLASFSASLAYLFGAYDFSSPSDTKQQKLPNAATPYADREELEKVNERVGRTQVT